jgi:hypothetical protein
MTTRGTHAARLRERFLSGCLLVIIGAAGCSAAPMPAAAPPAGGVGGSVAGPAAGVGVAGVSALPAGNGSAAGMMVGGVAGVGVRPAGSGGAGASASAGVGAAAGNVAPPAAGTSGGPAPVTEASVLQYHKDAKRSGMYTDAAFTRTAAAKLKKDTTFTAMVTGAMYAQPLYFEGGPGGKELLITATEQNEVTAFNAADGMVVWRKTLAAPVTSGLACPGNINPLGITGTPVIDAASRTLFVAAMTAGPKHQIFALSLDDGSTRTGWPVDVSTIKAGSFAFTSSDENQRGALVIVNSTVYVPYGGFFGDCGNYHGWVVGVPIANPSAPVAFATKAHAAGIWAPGGLASDGTSVFAATGNSMSDGGSLGSSPATWGHGNAILRLGPDLKTIAEGQTKDFFAAQNWPALDNGDLDVGGSGPILFDVPGATPSSLAMALGKGGVAYLLSVENLGGMGGMLQMQMVAGGGPGGGMIQAAAAYTTPTGTFVAFRAVQSVQGCGTGSGYLGALKVVKGAPPTMSVAWCAGGSSTGSPIVTTTDGMAESVVWLVANGKLLGFNGETGAPIFTGGATGDAVGTVSKFQTPIVAKGRLFIAASNQLVAYTLK